MTMPISVAGPLPRNAELQIQQLVRAMHRQDNVTPIEFADKARAFPGVILLPRVFPLVLDANMIRGELMVNALLSTVAR